jgi:hypothetical protein
VSRLNLDRPLRSLCRTYSTCLFKLETKFAHLAVPTEGEQQQIEELQTSIEHAPDFQEEPEIVAERGWNEARDELRSLIKLRDPRDFLTWDVIRRMGVFVNHSNYLDELRSLEADPLWEKRWRPALREDQCGRPEPFFKYRKSSATLIHHAYHVQQFEKLVGVLVEDYNWIVELGGGYGSLCRFIHRLGFQGQYLIFDLPEFSCLQRYFLSCVGIPVEAVMPAAMPAGVKLVSSLDLLSKQIREKGLPSLFIATWSLSETPIAFRRRFMALVGEFDAYLIGYQACYGTGSHAVDNRAFFSEWTSSYGLAGAQTELQWYDWVIPHLQQNHYLVGAKKTR